MQTTIPEKLRALLGESQPAVKTLDFAGSCDAILADNQMPFFPAYTDHGTPHVGSVLEAAELLIPESVWEKEGLTWADAAVLIAACFLHDLALHLREPGFLALVREDSPFRPLPWFDEAQRDRPADVPWPELWHAFRKEARRFSQSQLERILGPGHEKAPQIAFGEVDADPAEWTLNDRLLIGEFLRRHHARLAHEIAIYGFPGLDQQEFPVLAKSLPSFAEAIGVTARSHHEDMRVMADYLDGRSKGDLRPDGVAQLYLMGVLRIADYFQLEPGRATPLLMHLREPQSPVSVDEWKKHQAISAISWEHKDPHAATIKASASHTLRTHLQLGELIADLQRELDSTAAVLSETYGYTKLQDLQLTLQRVRTNLDEPALHLELDFVPVKARLRSAEDLFRLVVGDLYGNEPAVAGRELLQNAADAVRELEGWLSRRDTTVESEGFHQIPADVLVEVQEVDDQGGLLKVVDRGIGMTPQTVVNSFLTAGSTYREPFDDEGIDQAAALKWMKSGRFGVGVFASFLLGDEVRVTTRHITAKRGVSFTAAMGDDLVQMNWVDDVPFGTEIVVPFRFDHLPLPFEWEGDVEERYLYLLEQIAIFYQLTNPSVAYRFRDRGGEVLVGEWGAEIPSPNADLPDAWRSIKVPDFDAILWSLPSKEFRLDGFIPTSLFGCRMAHNGIVIRKPGEEDGPEDAYDWSSKNMERLLRKPSLAVFDTRHRLGIALNRYELSSRTLAFEETLLSSIGMDIVAHALVSGDLKHPLGNQWGLSPMVTATHCMPLIPALSDHYLQGDLLVLWFDDPWENTIGQDLLEIQLDGEGRPQPEARIALGLRELFIGEDFSMEEREDSSLRGRAGRATLSLGKMLNRDPVACVVNSHQYEPVVLDSTSVDESMQETLLVLANEINQSKGSLFGAAVLRRSDHPPAPRVEALARPWMEIVGGMLERDPTQRESRKLDLVKNVDGLQRPVDAWERHSQVPDWRDA